MIRSSTIQLLRIPFSFFLMPVYWFALSQIVHLDLLNAALIFFILHFLLYPASNAYNSFMDRDTDSIGGVENPQLPTRQLYNVSIILDLLAVAASFFISIYFMIGVILFIAASKAYSYRKIRIKKYPVLSFVIASSFQGGMVYLLVFHGAAISHPLNISPLPVIASSLLVGSFYPLTQIYQHRQDAADGVKTISMLLGYNGTFYFTSLIYFFALVVMGYYFASNLELDRFLVFLLFMIPTLIYFFWWFVQVRKDTAAANFKNSLRMNIIAAICTNAAFITLLIIDRL
jgi:1,4-dihydroxy-2-naphthoate octaprenyltransferase